MAALTFMAHPDAFAATMVASLQDGQVVSDGSFNIGSYESRVGEFFSAEASFVLPFLLPDLGPGYSFETASFRFQLFGKTEVFPPTVGVDLYGLDRRASDTLLTSDHYSGSVADPGATLLKRNVVDPSTALGVYDTDSATDAALVDYLNAQYEGGAGAGQYVFLRFSYAGDVPNENTAYDFLTQEASGVTEKPELTYTSAIPEPGAIALGAVAALTILARRRR